MKRIIILLLLMFSLEGCTSVKIIGANLPSLFAEQVGSYNVAYGTSGHQKLDVYHPKNNKVKNPIIIFFYGGRWQYGSKNDYRFVADAFTERGYVVVIPDYIKYPQGKFPDFVIDGAKAVAWTRENAWKYNGDIEQIYLVGHSAGAYIGAMLATDGRFMEAAGGKQSWIKGFAGLAGAYNFKPTEIYKKEFAPIFGEDPEAVCLCNYVKKDQPPILLLWGEEDKTIDRWQMDYFAEGIKSQGSEVETKTYPGIDHVNIVAALSQVRRNRAPVVDDVDAFFKRLVQNHSSGQIQ